MFLTTLYKRHIYIQIYTCVHVWGYLNNFTVDSICMIKLQFQFNDMLKWYLPYAHHFDLQIILLSDFSVIFIKAIKIQSTSFPKYYFFNTECIQIVLYAFVINKHLIYQWFLYDIFMCENLITQITLEVYEKKKDMQITEIIKAYSTCNARIY